MKKQYITFIEGNKESLEEAIKLAEENGYPNAIGDDKLTNILKCVPDIGAFGTDLSAEELESLGYTELKRPPTEDEYLPITEMLCAKETNLENGYKKYMTDDYKQDLNFLATIIPQVRILEQAQQEKLHYLETTSASIEKGWDESITRAKEEERERMVGMFDEMKTIVIGDDTFCEGFNFALQEVKERILSTN